MLALLAMPVQAQQDIDTLYRAAYCVGVLKGEEWYATTPAYEAGLISAEEALCKWFNDCSEHLKRETKKQQWLEELRYKRERYVAYVVARIGMRMDPTVKALVDKGEREEVRDLQSGAWKKMIEDCVEEDFSRHNGDGARTLYNAQQNHECRARRDQGAANTYACVNMPDRLPF
jgi:hypothetical protein